ncbi:hypothetical protein [Sodalis sp.]|uniref:hypothetical protein n=1 Tax=Sodalis sp. (in: enterobacteria) TaxID=1898979 RepID=UPI0038734FA7
MRGSWITDRSFVKDARSRSDNGRAIYQCGLGIPPIVGTQTAEFIGNFHQRYSGIRAEDSPIWRRHHAAGAVLTGDLDLVHRIDREKCYLRCWGGWY